MQPDKNNQNTQEANNMSVEKNNDRIRTESIHKTMAEEGGYIEYRSANKFWYNTANFK